MNLGRYKKRPAEQPRSAAVPGVRLDRLRCMLDLADVHDPDYPGGTFRVLKEKETAKFGEYRTRRLVLEACDRLSPA